MPPGLGVILFGGLSYVLFYASVANHGRFATHPWAGLLEDAYTGNTSTRSGKFTEPKGELAPPITASATPSATTHRGRRPTRPRVVAV